MAASETCFGPTIADGALVTQPFASTKGLIVIDSRLTALYGRIYRGGSTRQSDNQDSQGCPLIDKQRPILAQGDQYCACKPQLLQLGSEIRKEPWLAWALRMSNFPVDETVPLLASSIVNGCALC